MVEFFLTYSLKMPKVRTNRTKYPDGWELIEPTLRELDAKMREGCKWYFILLLHNGRLIKFSPILFVSFLIMNHCNLILFGTLQLKMIHMMARGNVKHCGRFSKLHIKGAATFSNFTIKEMKYLKNCMSSAWNKAMGTAT